MGKWLRLLFLLFAGLCVLAGLAAGTVILHDQSPPEAPWARWTLVFAALGLLGSWLVAGAASDRGWDEARLHLLRMLEMSARRGLPLGQALTAVGHDFEGPRARALHGVIARLDRGLPLSGALEPAVPHLVPSHAVEAVRAAEGDGKLAETLEALVQECLEAPMVRTRFHLALVYPALLLALGAALGLFLTPQLARDRNIDSLDPRYRAAMADGDAASRACAWGLVVLAAAAGAARLFRGGRLRRRAARLLDPLALRLPVLGGAVRLAAAERTCRALAPLLRAGTPLAPALERAGRASGNLSVASAAARAAATLREGGPVAETLRGIPALPRFVGIRAGAASGGTPDRFAASMDALATECSRRRRQREEALAASVYPVMILFCAAAAFLQYRGLLGYWEGARELARARDLPW
jgi:type II secretory pathway component PulF